MINALHVNTKLLLTFTLLNVGDYLTTKIIVTEHGFEAELNPLMRWLMETADSTGGMFWAKVIILAMLWIVYLAMQQRHKQPRRLTYVLKFGCLLYTIVVLLNTITIVLTG